MPTLLHQNSNACPLTKYFLTHNTNTDTKYFAPCNTNLDTKVNRNATNNSLECRKTPPLIDQRWWALTPVAIVWFTQYLEKSWENARKSKAVHQIIFHADHNWKQKYHGFICHCSNTPPDDAQRDIYVLSNISTFISTPDKLQRSKMYFSNWADCTSPPQRSVAEISQQQIWSVSKSLTDPIKVDRDATNYDKELLNEISCFSVMKGAAAGNGITLSIWTQTRWPLGLGVSDLTSHPSLGNVLPWPWPSNLIDISLFFFRPGL